MEDIICLDDSDGDGDAAPYHPPPPPPARRSPVRRPAPTLAPIDGSDGSDSSDIDDLATTARPTKAARLNSGRAGAGAVDGGGGARVATATAATTRVGGRSTLGAAASKAAAKVAAREERERQRAEKAEAKAREKAALAVERERSKAQRALEKEEERRRKAEDAQAAKELAKAARERDKTVRQQARLDDQLANGKHKYQQITTVMDTELVKEGFGRTLGDQFDMGLTERGKPVKPMWKIEKLPLENSITWRYHAPSNVAVGPPPSRCSLIDDDNDGSGGGGGGGGRGVEDVTDERQRRQEVQSAMYTMVYLKGDRFADMCVIDHEAARRLGGTGGGTSGTGKTIGMRYDDLNSTWGGPTQAVAPVGGLHHFLRTARRELPGHTLSLIIEDLKRSCVTRERQEYKKDKIGGFSTKTVDAVVARLAIATPGVRVTLVPDQAVALDHVMTTTKTLANRPFTKEEGVLDIMGHKAEKGASAGAALERAVAAGSRGAGIGLDGTGPASQSQSQSHGLGGDSQQWVPRVGESETQTTLGDSQQSFGGGEAGEGGGVPTRQRRVKTQGEIWASALMKIDGCAEAVAVAIVNAHPTMSGLMALYADQSLTESQKKNLLADLIRPRITHSAQAGRRVGPAVSERVYQMLRPRDGNDVGDEIVGVGVMER